MSAAPSKFLSAITKPFLKPFGALNKKIMQGDGNMVPGGAVPNPPAGTKGTANFRQVGSVPEDKSGFPVNK